jgi:hypothetical protein
MTQTKAELLQTRHQGDIRLGDADSTNYVGFKAPATVGSNLVWTLPATDGSANQFLQTNASGVLGWGTADVSSAMPLTGGTFTGNVKYNDNVKNIFGTGNDLNIFHNGTDSYIQDAGTGDLILQATNLKVKGYNTGELAITTAENGAVELYHNAVKKFETSAAGVSITGAATVSTNLTVTGDLTVSGTTTTINTQTLDVEDKNVVIGKVSSPSDTTADGGGWTLKGATDKTFNWVNATDAWTSSEHIHLGDNKKLLVGTGSDLEIYHDGSNSRIQSDASIVLSSKTNGPENYIKCHFNNAVELYYNNSKKFETTNTGINVTGAINVNGSALSTAPQITATADGAISAGNTVIIKPNGQVSKAALAYTAISPIDGLSGSDVNYPDASKDTADWRVAKIQDNYFIAVYKNETNSNRMDGAQFYIQSDGTVTTQGSVATILSSDHYILDIAHDPDRNQALLVYYRSNGRIYFQTIRKDTTTGFATGSTVMLTGAFSSKSNADNASLSYDTAANKFIFVLAEDDDNSNNVNVRYLDVTGNDAITIGSPVQIQSAAGSYVKAAFDSTAGKHLIVYGNTQSHSTRDIYGVVATLSGTNLTIGTPVAIDTGSNETIALAYSTTDSKFAMANFTDINNGEAVRYRTVTISGTSLSSGSENTNVINTTGNTGDTTELIYDPTLNKFYHIYRENYVGKFTPLTLSGTSVTRGTTVNSRNGNSVADQSVAYDSASNRFLFVFQNGATNKGLYQVWNSSSSATNLTTENYIGIAAASASDSASATIDVSGATNSNQSSLTPGQKYYVQKDGSLGLTAATPAVFAGTAIAATKLIVNDQQPVTAAPGLVHVKGFAAPNSLYVTFENLTATNVSYYLVKWSGINFNEANYNLQRLCGEFQFNGTWDTSSNAYFARYEMNRISNANRFGDAREDDHFQINNQTAYVVTGELQIPMHIANGAGVASNKIFYGRNLDDQYDTYFWGKAQSTSGANARGNTLTGVRFRCDNSSYKIGYVGRIDLYKYTY